MWCSCEIPSTGSPVSGRPGKPTRCPRLMA
jgi:hypothetical protein